MTKQMGSNTAENVEQALEKSEEASEKPTLVALLLILAVGASAGLFFFEKTQRLEVSVLWYFCQASFWLSIGVGIISALLPDNQSKILKIQFALYITGFATLVLATPLF